MTEGSVLWELDTRYVRGTRVIEVAWSACKGILWALFICELFSPLLPSLRPCLPRLLSTLAFGLLTVFH